MATPASTTGKTAMATNIVPMPLAVSHPVPPQAVCGVDESLATRTIAPIASVQIQATAGAWR